VRDRRVHARYRGMDVVRYDRAGKWYLEPTDSRLRRQWVKLGDAVNAAVWGVENLNGVVLYGLSGGAAFDKQVREALGREDASDPNPPEATP
jgi:hypothetical protein